MGIGAIGIGWNLAIPRVIEVVKTLKRLLIRRVMTGLHYAKPIMVG